MLFFLEAGFRNVDFAAEYAREEKCLHAKLHAEEAAPENGQGEDAEVCVRVRICVGVNVYGDMGMDMGMYRSPR